MNQKTVLLVDDEKKVLFLLSDMLEKEGFKVNTTTYPSEALEILGREPVDAVVLDLVMPQADGMETLQAIKRRKPEVPVVMLSGHGTIEKAVQSLKLGADDFLEKTVSTNRIALTLNNIMRRAELEKEKQHLLRTVREKHVMIGTSPAINKVRSLIKRIAPMDSPALIVGESGTGKELVARALHFSGHRGARPFITVNATAFSEGVIQTELFGHKKGSFTDAKENRAGYFEQAHGGTLFLDEIADMSIDLQPKLLRAIDTGEIQRVGGTGSKKVDVRIIAATNQDLEAAIKEGRFREDLYYRLEVLTVRVPPLRERKEDIPLLVEYFTKEHHLRTKRPEARFHPHAMQFLIACPWPGNIRQLRNTVEKVLVFSDAEEIAIEDIRMHLQHRGDAIYTETLAQSLERLEKDIIVTKLQALDWDYDQVIKELDISRATLFNKIKGHGISGKRERGKNKSEELD